MGDEYYEERKEGKHYKRNSYVFVNDVFEFENVFRVSRERERKNNERERKVLSIVPSSLPSSVLYKVAE